MRVVLATFGIVVTSLGAVFLKRAGTGRDDDLAVALLAGAVLAGVGIWVLATLAFGSG